MGFKLGLGELRLLGLLKQEILDRVFEVYCAVVRAKFTVLSAAIGRQVKPFV